MRGERIALDPDRPVRPSPHVEQDVSSRPEMVVTISPLAALVIESDVIGDDPDPRQRATVGT